MLAVRYHRELATPELYAWLRSFVRYDAEGRCGTWLAEDSPLPPRLAAVALAVCPGRSFSGVILQAYRDGRAATECHSDRGATGFCCTLSLGATRTLRLHRVPEGCDPRAGCGDPGLDVVEVLARSGTALLMDEGFQDNWHHMVAPDPGVTGERLSLVFRTRPGTTREG